MEQPQQQEPAVPTASGWELSDDPEVLKLQLTPFTSEAFCEAFFSGLCLRDTSESIEAAIPRETGEVPEAALRYIRAFMSEERVVLYTMPAKVGAFLIDLRQGVYLLMPGVDGCGSSEASRYIRLFVTKAFISLDCTRIVCRIEPGDVVLSQALQDSGFRHEHTLPNGRHMVLNLDDWVPRVGARWFHDQCAAFGTGTKGVQALIRYGLLVDDWHTLGRAIQELGDAGTETNN
jgi:hypothetical protein